MEHQSECSGKHPYRNSSTDSAYISCGHKFRIPRRGALLVEQYSRHLAIGQHEPISQPRSRKNQAAILHKASWDMTLFIIYNLFCHCFNLFYLFYFYVYKTLFTIFKNSLLQILLTENMMLHVHLPVKGNPYFVHF